MSQRALCQAIMVAFAQARTQAHAQAVQDLGHYVEAPPVVLGTHNGDPWCVRNALCCCVGVLIVCICVQRYSTAVRCFHAARLRLWRVVRQGGHRRHHGHAAGAADDRLGRRGVLRAGRLARRGAVVTVARARSDHVVWHEE